MQFCQLGLCDALLCAIRERGFEVPTPLQARVIPEVLRGCNVRMVAPAGGGKTAAYLLPLLQRLMGVRADTSRPLRAIVLVPDGPSMQQVFASVQVYGRHLPFACNALSDSPARPEYRVRSRTSADIAVATPAGLAKASARRRIHLGAVEVVVLDDIGFGLGSNPHGHLKRLMLRLPRGLQTVILNTAPIDRPGLASGLRVRRLRDASPERAESTYPGHDIQDSGGRPRRPICASLPAPRRAAASSL